MNQAGQWPEVGAVVMAAGAGRRMGGVPKSLLRRDGEPLLLRQIRLLALAGVGDIVVVLGHHAERLAAVLGQAGAAVATPAGVAGLRWVLNPAPDAGPGSSLRCGLAALPASLSAVLVVLGDQPLLQDGDAQAMLWAWRERSAGVELLVPQHAGQPGHPIVFGPAVRQAVMQQPGGQGVREWRRGHPAQVGVLPVSHARFTTDVDAPDDVARLREQHGVALELPAA